MKIFHYKGYGVHPSKCGVSIIGGDDGKTVVLTELPDNPGTSVTNFAEGIATAVKHELLPDFPFYKIKWVEHYFAVKPLFPESFDRVSLTWDKDAFHNARWTSLDKEEARKIKSQMLI